jgi:hypothetical protein
VSVVDRRKPLVSCSEWHGDGTAGEDDRASHLIVEAPAWAMGEARPRPPQASWASTRQGARQLALITGASKWGDAIFVFVPLRR